MPGRHPGSSVKGHGSLFPSRYAWRRTHCSHSPGYFPKCGPHQGKRHWKSVRCSLPHQCCPLYSPCHLWIRHRLSQAPHRKAGLPDALSWLYGCYGIPFPGNIGCFPDGHGDRDRIPHRYPPPIHDPSDICTRIHQRHGRHCTRSRLPGTRPPLWNSIRPAYGCSKGYTHPRLQVQVNRQAIVYRHRKAKRL